MTIKEQIAQMERQCVQLRELRELLQEPWEAETDEHAAMRATIQRQSEILRRIADTAEPLEQTEREAFHDVQMYELVIDSKLLEAIKAAGFTASLPTEPVAASAQQDDGEIEECPF